MDPRQNLIGGSSILLRGGGSLVKSGRTLHDVLGLAMVKEGLRATRVLTCAVLMLLANHHPHLHCRMPALASRHRQRLSTLRTPACSASPRSTKTQGRKATGKVTAQHTRLRTAASTQLHNSE